MLTLGCCGAATGSVAAPLFACVPAPAAVEAPPPQLAPGAIQERHPALCPAGQVPQPLGVVAPKGMPLRAERLQPNVSLHYLYNTAYQFFSATEVQGLFTQDQPTVAAGDYHSLAEIAGESADERQIIEVGWTVDPGLNGDRRPHLFVFHWINGVPTCYNGCNYVQVSAKRYPGMAVSVTATGQMYGFRYYKKNWWVGYQGEWIGYFPGTEWKNGYTHLGLTQWFGEVAAGSTKPCTDMGNGRFGTRSGAAAITAMKFNTTLPAAVTTFETNAAYYALSPLSAFAMRFGGPGAC
jgi:hypothetical protein